MKRLTFALIMVIGSLITSSFALDSNEKINYQGRLVDGTNLVNGVVTTVFRLYDQAAPGGTLYYAQTQVVTVVDGLYSTTIGRDLAVPSLESALEHPSVYLEVEVNGTVLSPREHIVQAAYSLTDVNKTGDTMTGPLNITTTDKRALIIESDGQDIAIGSYVESTNSGIAIGYDSFANSGEAYGDVSYASNNSAAYGYEARAIDLSAALGEYSVAIEHGVAAGYQANGNESGTAVGYQSSAPRFGAVVGKNSSASNFGVAMGYLADGNAYGVALGFSAVAHNYGVAAGSGAKGTNYGVAVGEASAGSDQGAAVGFNALATNSGTAVGYQANGSFQGAAVGSLAKASARGAAVGVSANGENYGAVIGFSANGNGSGAAVGDNATANNVGAAVGCSASAFDWGAALGYKASGDLTGVAVGRESSGRGECIAVGAYANSGAAIHGMALGMNATVPGGVNNGTAIGYMVTNTVSDSTRVRGDLYLDGGTQVWTNDGFGSANWGVKAFTIDHPLDPQNKVLRHYTLEGPQVWNVYKGTAQLDALGMATIQLPDYFEALNRNPQYDLTPIGSPMPNLFVKQTVKDNQFVIGGGVANGQVCWTVSGERNDPAAIEDLKQRPVEQLKSELKPGQAEAENAAVNTDTSAQ